MMVGPFVAITCKITPQNATFRGARVLNLLNQDFCFVYFGGHLKMPYICRKYICYVYIEMRQSTNVFLHESTFDYDGEIAVVFVGTFDSIRI
jgi:hypothetical protein